MKNTRLLILPLLLATLAGCTKPFVDSESDSNSYPESENDSENNTGSEGGTDVESESESESEGYVTPTQVEGDVDFYAINDFHGAVVQSGYEMGIQRVGTFLKQKGQNENTVLINSGDMWQGSIDSNYSFGEMLTRINNEIEFDCFTIGNHEFDWGDKYIKQNAKLKDPETGHQTPFLAANIYNYDIKTKKTGDYANLGKKYTIKQLENGVRVGIIGVIGSGQITSITSGYVDKYDFINPLNVVKDLAKELREEKNCHIVVASVHNGSEIASTEFVKHVDAVFAAHTHKKELTTVSGVPVIQSGNNGRYIGNIKLHVAKDGTVTTVSKTNLQSADVSTSLRDDGIQAILDEYQAGIDAKGTEVVAKLSSEASRYEEIPNMVCTALADHALEQGISVDYTLINGGRANLSSGDITYAELFKAIPFDNEVYVAEVKGSELQTQLNQNYFYRVDSKAFSTSKTYTIAVIDYLATHRNNARDYDKFPSLNIKSSFTLSGYELFNYRDATYEWLKDLKADGITTLNVSDFSGSNAHYNSSVLTTAQTFGTDKYVSK